MFSWSVESNGVVFVFYDDSQNIIDPQLWKKDKVISSHSETILLQELLGNGSAFVEGDGILVPHDELVIMDPMDQMNLELPSRYPYTISIDSKGTPNQSDFIFDWGFFVTSGGEKLSVKRTGAILDVADGAKYLLSKEQYELCALLDNFNNLSDKEKPYRSNLIKFAKIKTLSEKSGAVLSKYLEKENVLVPDSIGIKIESMDEDSISIVPEIMVDIEDEETSSTEKVEIAEAEQFEKRFKKGTSVKSVYPLQKEDMSRERLVFPDEKMPELEKMKKHKTLRGEEKRRFLKSPQDFYNPDEIDLDSFSSRVIDYGYYEPKFYSFVMPYKSEWVPAIAIEKALGERETVTVNTEEELEDLKVLSDKALSKKENNLQWKGKDISTDQARALIGKSQDHFKAKREKKNGEDNKSSKKVLIIKENVEELETVDTIKGSSEFELSYENPPHLASFISVFEHQKEGIAWLQSLYRQNPHSETGALLADDMGLGKTLQILSFIDWHSAIVRTGKDEKPYLIVAPVVLLENWESEYRKFFPDGDLATIKLYGSVVKDVFSAGGKSSLKKAIYLTTYETLRKHQTLICAVDWAVIALDEAQRIKTPGTLVTNAAKALKGDFKIAASGTPVENTLVDMWSIVDFIVPGLLGSAKDFTKEFQTPLKDKDTDVKLLGEKLRTKIGVFIKRRMKKDVLDGLPEKKEISREKNMPSVQTEYYQSELNSMGNSKKLDSFSKKHILEVIQHIRDISDHPYLIDRNLDDSNLQELVDSSAKLMLTLEMIEEIEARGQKVILFATRKPIQRVLKRLLLDKFSLINVGIINGDTPASSRGKKASKHTRQAIIDDFQNKMGFNAIVMSPLAAGVGLTITAANNVIHYSRHWNPAKEDQATDRVYRIGQKKDVNVYYPIATSSSFKTFDLILNDLLQRKKELASASLFPTERSEVRIEDVFSCIKN